MTATAARATAARPIAPTPQPRRRPTRTSSSALHANAAPLPRRHLRHHRRHHQRPAHHRHRPSARPGAARRPAPRRRQGPHRVRGLPECSTHPAASGAAKLDCPTGVVSPGLINSHDHLTYNHNLPAPDNGFSLRAPQRVGACVTGAGFNAVGRQLSACALSFTSSNTVPRSPGVSSSPIIRDDGGVADNARRIVQDMIVNDKVGLIGIGITPTSLAIAQLVTEERFPLWWLSSGASVTVTRVALHGAGRFSAKPAGLDHGRVGVQERQQARRHPGQRLGAGIESETAFRGPLHESRRRDYRSDPHSACQIRILRRSCSGCADLNPDTAFIYFAGPQASIFAKQFAERGLANSGIKIIGPGDLTDDNDLNTMGDQMLGMITSGSYSAAHRFLR